jgi:hypothetical protein
VSFGGNIVSSQDEVITVKLRDAVRQRIYLASLGLYVTVDAGAFTRFTLSVPGRRLTLEFADAAKGIEAKRREPKSNTPRQIGRNSTQLDEHWPAF